MAATLMYIAPPAPVWWLWLSCLVAMALIPSLSWLAQSARARRIVVALVIAIVLGAGMVSASIIDYPDWCNPDYIIYGICWPW